MWLNFLEQLILSLGWAIVFSGVWPSGFPWRPGGLLRFPSDDCGSLENNLEFQRKISGILTISSVLLIILRLEVWGF